MSWLGLPTFTDYDNLTVIYPNPLALNMSNWSIEEYDEHPIPLDDEWREEEMQQTEQYWSDFPQWRDETTDDAYFHWFDPVIHWNLSGTTRWG